ncbi:microfibrillar-associated protein 2 [Strix uralensis]|uniref:microfibrillar-associated protein 2 n=1 Tax=Strix uralensis TaxID=36305 RepID=UPI003DA79038
MAVIQTSRHFASPSCPQDISGLRPCNFPPAPPGARGRDARSVVLGGGQRGAAVGDEERKGLGVRVPPPPPADPSVFPSAPSRLLRLHPGPRCSSIAAVRMRAVGLFLLCLPAALLVQGQYSRFEGITYPEPVQYSQYDQQAEIQDYYDYHDVTPRAPEEQFRYQSQQQSQQEIVPAPTPAAAPETEPTEPGPLDCREEQYPCTRLYSVHKPCKQCLNEICFYSLRRVYVINKEICVRTVCAHEELLRADLCRDKFSKCGVMATSGLCQTVVASCARSCGGC